MNSKLFVFVCLIVSARCEDERKLSVYLNPDCSTQLGAPRCEDITFLHIEAVSVNNTLHYLWDFTGIPSLFLARTDLNTSLIMDWENFLSGKTNSVIFSNPPEFMFSSVIHKFLLFDDKEDRVNVDAVPADLVKIFNTHFFQWSRQNLTQKDDEVVMTMKGRKAGHEKPENGSFVMKLSAFGSTKHGSELPHLYHSAHSMQLDIFAENVTSNFTHPRIAVSILLLSSENKEEGTFKINKRRNLDDEFTPGVFDVFDIVSPRSSNGSEGAFVQYRPVCYTTPERTVSGSTQLNQGNIKGFKNTEEVVETFYNTLPYSIFGYRLGSMVAQRTNITFGARGDGFYSKSNYTSFSMLLGSGSPPIERLSAFVVTFAAIGLGVPLLVLLVGGTTVCVKRYRN